MPQEGGRKKSHPQYSTTAQQKNKAWRQEQGHPGNAYEQNVYKDNAYSTRVRQRRVRAERQRRRRQARIRRYIKISLLCASILAGIFMLKICWKYLPALRKPVLLWKLRQKLCSGSKTDRGDHGNRIQGLPADVYAAHPNWTEDFLTVNEYSRPGDPLTEVKIFCTLHGESWDQRGPEPQLFRTAERQS